MAIAENHQRFLQRIQLDLHGAGGFVLLMVGVGVAGGEKLRTGFRDSRSSTPPLNVSSSAASCHSSGSGRRRGKPHIGQGQNGNAQMILPLPREGAMKRAEAQRFYDFHCVCVKLPVDISRQPGCLLKNNPFFGLIDIRLCHNR